MSPIRLLPFCGGGRSTGALLGLLLATAPSASAQEAIEDLVFVVGTTARDTQPQPRDWAYLLWDAAHLELLRDRSYAVYAKPGSPASPAPYVRKAVVGLQTDPAVLKVLLQRGVNLGDSLAPLGEQLDALFQNLQVPAGLPVPDKLSLVIQGALNDPDHFDNLALLARLHPGVALCLGFAYTEIMTGAGPTTYEVRGFDPVSNHDLGVLGRVTLVPGAPVVLPAPGAPVAVPEPDARGNLNLKLRWATSPELRRLSMLSYGFNVFRIPRAFAEQHGHDVTPPTLGQLDTYLKAGNAVRINRQPILAEEDFDPTNPANPTANPLDVANFDPAKGGDPATFFVADDNGRYRNGGTPFPDGGEFYYFVTARDVLGRDGLVSAGTRLMICDRLPPPAPSGLRVENDYAFANDTGTQRLRVFWRPFTGTNETIQGYYLYRWLNPADVQSPAAGAAQPISPLIAQNTSVDTLSFLDSGAGAPTSPQQDGLPVWYTVRALDNSACGGNLSAHSRAVFGVLRHRAGPPAPSGRLGYRCARVAVTHTANALLNHPNADPDLMHFQLSCTRDNPDLDYAEFGYGFNVDAPTQQVTRIFFPERGDSLQTPVMIARSNLTFGDPIFFCRVGNRQGRASDFVPVSVTRDEIPGLAQQLRVGFSAGVLITEGGDCGVHSPTTPGSNQINPITVCVNFTAEAKEYRIYRRVDSGPLTLISQGPTPPVPPLCHDDADLPATSSVLCYFVQVLDEQGNASPLVQVGDCVPIETKGQLPKPLLAPLEPAGTATNPRMRIRWFAPPAGIERFAIYIVKTGLDLPDTLSDSLSPNTIQNPPTNVGLEPAMFDGKLVILPAKRFLTPLVGPDFGDGAMFESEVPIALNQQYMVIVKAVDKAGLMSWPSIGQRFTWAAPTDPALPVPWPARPLPPVFSFHSNIVAVQLSNDVFAGVGVRIGHYVFKNPEAYVYRQLPTLTNPVEYLYRDAENHTLFPVAMYRYQVTNLFFPQVSGDLVQVTPLMEKIAYVEVTQFDLPFIVVVDPFIGMSRPPGGAIGAVPYLYVNLYLLDTQPVIRGAAYRYLLVRFDPKTLEMVQVIPSNPVEIPP